MYSLPIPLLYPNEMVKWLLCDFPWLFKSPLLSKPLFNTSKLGRTIVSPNFPVVRGGEAAETENCDGS